ELVRDPLDLDRGDGRALERREQHAAERVPERVTEAAVERLDLEDPTLLVHFLVDDLRDLEFHETGTSCQSASFLLRVELDDERLLHPRVDLGTLGPLDDLAGETAVVGLPPRASAARQAGRCADNLRR